MEIDIYSQNVGKFLFNFSKSLNPSSSKWESRSTSTVEARMRRKMLRRRDHRAPSQSLPENPRSGGTFFVFSKTKRGRHIFVEVELIVFSDKWICIFFFAELINLYFCWVIEIIFLLSFRYTCFFNKYIYSYFPCVCLIFSMSFIFVVILFIYGLFNY